MTETGSGRRPGVRSLAVERPANRLRRKRPRGGRRLAAWVLAGFLGSAVGLLGPAAGRASAGMALGGDGASAEAWRVVLVDVETGQELWWAPAHAGDAVWYAYTHSADKTPVQSLLRVAPPPEGLVLELERYLWYGAGLEYRRDRGVVLDGEWVVVHGPRAIGRLVLRVAGTVAQTVTVGDETVALADLADYGRRVALEVRP